MLLALLLLAVFAGSACLAKPFCLAAALAAGAAAGCLSAGVVGSPTVRAASSLLPAGVGVIDLLLDLFVEGAAGVRLVCFEGPDLPVNVAEDQLLIEVKEVEIGVSVLVVDAPEAVARVAEDVVHGLLVGLRRARGHRVVAVAPEEKLADGLRAVLIDQLVGQLPEGLAVEGRVHHVHVLLDHKDLRDVEHVVLDLLQNANPPDLDLHEIDEVNHLVVDVRMEEDVRGRGLSHVLGRDALPAWLKPVKVALVLRVLQAVALSALEADACA
jgi:hypothetical protein